MSSFDSLLGAAGRAARAAVLALAALAFAFVAAVPAGAAANGRPGTLAPSFSGGSVVHGFGTVAGEGGAAQAAPMPDGGFVVRSRGSVGRYLADGSPDIGFGVDGYLIGVGARSIATTADGRIYVLAPGRRGMRLTRLLPDSSPDPSFGRGGSVDLGAHMPPLEDVLVGPRGAAYVAGTDFLGGTVAVEAVRVRPGGRVVPTYGRHGLARALFSTTNVGKAFLYGLDGERLAFVADAGTFSKGSASWRDIQVGRFDRDGVAEPSLPDPIMLGGTALVGPLSAIAGGPDGGFTVVAGARLVHLSAAGAPAPGAPGNQAPNAEAELGRSFSAAAFQPDGKVVVGGRTIDEEPARLVLARLDPDGSLDPTFGDGGLVSTGVEVGDEGAPQALSVLAGGDLLLGGATAAKPPALAAVRLSADGVPAPGFGSGGALVTAPVAYSDDKVEAVAAEPGGGVLATGMARGRVLVADYRADGRPDPAFGDGGFFLAGPAQRAAVEAGSALLRLPGGRVLVGTRSPAGASLIMLGAHGRPIGSFGQGGALALADFDKVSALARSASGAILVAGSSRVPCRFLVERLGPGGGVDRTFGTADGVARIHRSCRATNDVDMVQRPDGDLVLAVDGTRTIEELTANGRSSPRFTIRGADRPRLPVDVGAIALDPQGRLIVGGRFEHRVGLIRLERDGALDRGFGRDGVATREVGREAKVTGLAVEADGKVLAVGTAETCPPLFCAGPTALIARFDPDGAVDPEFGRRGVWTGRREASALDSLALAGEGALFAGGWSTLGSDRNLLLVKVRR